MPKGGKGCFKQPKHGPLLLFRNPFRPPGIHIMGRTIIEVVEQSQSAPQGNSICKVRLYQSVQASPRIRRQMRWLLRLNVFHITKNYTVSIKVCSTRLKMILPRKTTASMKPNWKKAASGSLNPPPSGFV